MCIDDLQRWVKEGPPEQKRHWTISGREGGRIVCYELSWRFGESQLGSIQKYAYTVEEGIRLALIEFRSWEDKTRLLKPFYADKTDDV